MFFYGLTKTGIEAMPNPFLGVRIPPEVEQALIDRMHQTGESKSEIVIAALKAYLNLPSCSDRLAEVEKRLSEVESTINRDHNQETDS